MYIQNDLLTDVNHDFKTNKSSSGKNICDFLIIHYTGSYEGVRGDINQCVNLNIKVSWHLTIDRKGQVYQHADFRKITWHAGKSFWKSRVTDKEYENLNKYSIGIELDNAGKLTQISDNKFKTDYGQKLTKDQVYKDDNGNFWEKYSIPQLESLYEVSKIIVKKYKTVEILGHEDIAPLRKTDPGPAFDMEILRSICGK